MPNPIVCIGKIRQDSKKEEKIKLLEIGGEKVWAVGGGKKISFRAASSEVFKFMNKVRLVVIAAGEGNIGPIMMRRSFNELINLLETNVAAQLLGGHTDAIFEFASKMATAQTKVTRKSVDGDTAFASLYGLDGFLSYQVIAEIRFQAVFQIRADGFDARLGC